MQHFEQKFRVTLAHLTESRFTKAFKRKCNKMVFNFSNEISGKRKGLTALVKFAVCDDERGMTDYISDRLRECYPEDCEIKKYEDGKGLLADSRSQLFDALFLDIDMPEPDGMEIARAIREDNQYVKIIFVTNKDNLVYSTFKYVPFRFIRKTYLNEELPEAAEALRDSIAQSNATVIFNIKNEKICVQVCDIVYAEVKNHTITVFLTEAKLTVFKSMDELDAELGKFGFIRTHKSFLVNHRHVKSILQRNILTDANQSIPLSRSRADEVKLKLQQWSRKK